MAAEQADLFGTGSQRPEGVVLQRPEPRPEDDEFLLDILDRFGGDVVGITPLQNPPKTVWVEVIRPHVAQGRRRSATGRGETKLVRLDETILLGRYGGYEKAQRKGSARPWQYQWADGTPMGLGLFTTKELADSYKSRR